MNPLLLSLLSFAPVAGTTPAAHSIQVEPREIVHEAHFSADALALQERIVLPRFDPGFGTLQRVELEVGLAIDGQVGIENTGPEIAFASLQLLGRLRTEIPGVAGPAFVPIDARADLFLGAYDGACDFAGASGRILPAALGSTSVYATESGLEAFETELPSEEDPSGAFLVLPLALRGGLRLDGIPQCAMRAAWHAEVVVRVRYVYTPA